MRSRTESDRKYDQSEKGKARCHRYNISQKRKESDKKYRDRIEAEGRCRECSRPLVDGNCPVCSEGGTMRKQLWRELRRGIDP